MKHRETCPYCAGTGIDSEIKGPANSCMACDGKGYYTWDPVPNWPAIVVWIIIPAIFLLAGYVEFMP